MRKRKVSLDEWEDHYNYVYSIKSGNNETNERYRTALKKFMWLCIDKELTKLQKDILLAYYIDGKDMQYIADEYQVHISTISRHIKTAKNRINDRFDYFYEIYKICKDN